MEFQKKESKKIYMKNKVYLIWLINDDVDPMVVGIATSEDVYVKCQCAHCCWRLVKTWSGLYPVI